jgi:DNA-binding LytR/AlgR family response regulator
MLKRELPYLTAITALCAILIAASDVGQHDSPLFLILYAYWLVRIFIEAAFFIAFREVIERLFNINLSQVSLVAMAIVFSLIPFVLTVTALDIVLGFPELGLETAKFNQGSKIAEFAFELLYLFDNHLAFCLLLTMPRALFFSQSKGTEAENFEEQSQKILANSFLCDLTPSLKGAILWAEAQEHYVKLTTPDESRMVLHRFSDILRELSETDGIRVHRSHWVAFEAISETYKEGTNIRIRLTSGETLPVSRSYRKILEEALDQREPTIEINLDPA